MALRQRLLRALSLSYPLLHQSNPIPYRLLSTPVSTTSSAAAVFPSSNQLARPFTSTPALSRKVFDPETDEIGPDTILFEGCDYNHWLITIDFPKDSNITREQMIETYVDTAAQVFGSVEEAKKKIYALSTTTYQGFQVECSEETSEKFKSLPGVVFVLPDSYIDPANKEYGGDKYVNGEIFPRPPPVHYGRRDNSDRRRRDNYGPPNQQNYGRGQQQNYGPPQPQNNVSPPRQDFGEHTRQNFGPSPPRQDFATSPPRQEFSLPPSRQGSAPPPPQQHFASPPPPRQGFAPPPSGQGFAPPPPGQGFTPPPPGQSFAPPPPRQDFASPPQRQGFAPPPPRQGFAPPPRQDFAAPPRQDFAAPSRQDYGPPPRQEYGPPPQQNYGLAPQQSNAPPSQINYGPPPRQNYGLPAQQNYGLPPQQNHRPPPQQNHWNHPNSPPQQNYAPQGSGDRGSFTPLSNAYQGNLDSGNNYREGQRDFQEGSSQSLIPPEQSGFSPDSAYGSPRGAVSEQALGARRDFSSIGNNN